MNANSGGSTMNSALKAKVVVPLLLGLAIAFSPILGAQDWDRNHRDRDDHHDRDNRHEPDNDSPLTLIGVIGIPGNPISSTDIASVDQATERLFFTDRGNGPAYSGTPPAGFTLHGAVDVVDAENDLFIGRITTGKVGGSAVFFAGANSANRNLGGPNGVVSGASLTIWAGDGDDTLKVADVNPNSATYLQLIDSIPLANRSAVSMCGATCQRADELAYDPEDHIVMVATDAPVSIPPYASFVNADTHALIGQINFAAQGLGTGGGLEQPLWVPALHRFFQTLPTTSTGFGKIAIVDPRGPNPHVTGVIDLAPFKCSGTGEALGDDGHVLVSCGSFPLVIDLHGAQIGPGVTQVGGGDEVNFNPGDGNFVVSSNIGGNSANPVVLGVIDSDSGRWLQNTPLPNGVQPGAVRAGNLAAFGENSHVFVIVHPATPPATDVCANVGFVGTGCVAVFGHTNEEANENRGGDRDDR
jgi:hypothetical protein